MKKKYSLLNNIGYVYSDIIKHSKFLFIILSIIAVSQIFLPVIDIFIPKLAVEAVTAANRQSALINFGIIISTSAILTIADIMCRHLEHIHITSFQRVYLKRLLNKYLTCDYSVLESEEGQTKYRKALSSVSSGNDYGSGVPCMIYASVDFIVKIAGLVIFTGMLTNLNPILAVVIILLSIVDAVALKKARDYENSRRKEYGNALKKSAYLERASADVKAGKDLRIFHMRDRFAALWANVVHDYKSILWACKFRHATADAVNALTTCLRSVTAYAYLIYMVYNGGITIAEFVLYFGAVSKFSDLLRGIAYFMFRLNLASIQISELREFLDIDEETRGNKKLGNISAPPTIEFRNVTFAYKGASEPVLENINLTITPGEKIAIVGVNGAGKTTIVKLLCGFYLPTAGDILINGISTRDIEKEELIRLYSVIFQESVILPFTLAENISMNINTDKKRVQQTLEKSDFTSKLNRLTHGMESQMTKELHEDGIILSGGEQQKLLMARALYKDAPVLIMDEPTAALDPIAESETYEKFHSISQDKTAVYISHRLASTRFCDRIILISGKSIAEASTHDELVQKGGEYAKMFEVQKKYYEEVE